MPPSVDQYLVTFCNQLASVRHSACIVDFNQDGLAWIDADSCQITRDFGGFCGACIAGEHIVLVTQSSAEAMLAVVELETGKIQRTLQLEGIRDPHSIVHWDGHIYICSTGTNEIYRFKIDGDVLHELEVFWQYPNVGYDRDVVHLNGLCRVRDRLVASCFGPRKADGTWGKKGRVFFLDSNQSIRTNLNQPHSPLAIDNKFFFAESGSGKVFILDQSESGTWVENGVIELHGYTRGLAQAGDKLIAGISEPRSLSRSRKTRVPQATSAAHATIFAIDLATHEVKPVFDISPYAREIYEIVPLKRTGPIATAYSALRSRIDDMEETIDRYEADMQIVNAKVSEFAEESMQKQAELNTQRLSKSSLQSVVQDLQAELSSQQASARNLRAGLAAEQARAEGIKVDLATREKELAAESVAAEGLQTQLTAEKAVTSGLRAELATREKELAAESVAAEDLQAQLTAEKAVTSGLRAELANLETALSSEQSLVMGLRAQLESKVTTIEAQEEHAQALAVELAVTKASRLVRIANALRICKERLLTRFSSVRQKHLLL